MKKIHNICQQINNLDDQDLDFAESKASEKANYTHPLKHATQSRINEAGQYNLRVLKALRELHSIIKAG